MGDIENKWNIAVLIGCQLYRIGAGGLLDSCKISYNQFDSGVKPEVDIVSINEFIIIIQKQAGGGSNPEKAEKAEWEKYGTKNSETLKD